MSITHLTSLSQLDTILSKSKDKLSVIDFHASWCGPCHAIAPTFEALAKQYPSVNFLKCDVDAVSDVAQKYKVTAMPTFAFLKGNTQIDTLRGADRAGLTEKIRKHATSSGSSSATSAFSGKGRTLGGEPAAPDVAGEVKVTLDKASQGLNSLDPQLKVLMLLLGLYFIFWFYG
ncbi:Peptide-N(4)-(N-acetyl-beta-glucosaminyl)asparagine amidase [Psilocybe cubensis]|uniref:Peptide-N(4)-(N-acetyl-beta-glucosaminyl)asparagine amidase n=2 Tax=Psilocybe cubensis TaxID=181762 RepID=A0ACB8HFK4_PSICU|nr:Peptide-N(4)-(N-acetyl-beta-glucosaminyl)asparagine amidase [Psilocybe cubensis]KAH9486479.1 Peptide-N(4)-(N-acetyl-beta-glucosaminyl)asparagine amidase [Psilocybe cubensis]